MSAGVRGRGWGSVAGLALTTAVLSVVRPDVLIFVPLALLFVAFPPRRPLLLAVAGVVGWLTLAGPARGSLWYFERGWALVLGAWFVALVSLLPSWTFLSAALAALGMSAVTALAFLLANQQGFGQLDLAIASRLRQKATDALATWTRDGDRIGEELTRTVYTAADLQAKLYPAMLALASLAALGIAWWAFGRLARGERNPLGSLRDFRFRDELVWVLIVAVALIVIPWNQQVTRAGQNLLMFMGALYALRGVAVLVVIGGGIPGPLAMLLGAVLIVFMLPVGMATTFVVGLSDTWLDIRARRRTSSSPGS